MWNWGHKGLCCVGVTYERLSLSCVCWCLFLYLLQLLLNSFMEATFFQLTDQNSVLLQLHYTLELSKPIPTCGLVLEQLHNTVYGKGESSSILILHLTLLYSIPLLPFLSRDLSLDFSNLPLVSPLSIPLLYSLHYQIWSNFSLSRSYACCSSISM